MGGGDCFRLLLGDCLGDSPKNLRMQTQQKRGKSQDAKRNQGFFYIPTATQNRSGYMSAGSVVRAGGLNGGTVFFRYVCLGFV